MKQSVALELLSLFFTGVIRVGKRASAPRAAGYDCLIFKCVFCLAYLLSSSIIFCIALFNEETIIMFIFGCGYCTFKWLGLMLLSNFIDVFTVYGLKVSIYNVSIFNSRI
jgi:hypothetical protein